MFVEPLNLAVGVPPTGAGNRRYLNQYLDLASAYGGLRAVKRGSESITFGEKVAMVHKFSHAGLLTLPYFVWDLSRTIDRLHRQAQHIGSPTAAALLEMPFKVIPINPAPPSFLAEAP